MNVIQIYFLFRLNQNNLIRFLHLFFRFVKIKGKTPPKTKCLKKNKNIIFDSQIN